MGPGKTVTFNDDDDQFVFKNDYTLRKNVSNVRHDERFSNMTYGNKMMSSIHESEKPELMLPMVYNMEKAPRRYISHQEDDSMMSGDSREFDAVIENEFWINRNEEVLNRASVP